MYALDATSGRTRWHARLSGRPGEPAATADAVYAATDDAEVYALRASDRRRLWRVRPGSRMKDATPGPVRTSGPVVLVSILVYVNPPDRSLVARDVRTGDVVWSAPVRDSLGRRTLDLLGADILFGRSEADEERTEIVAYDPRTGDVRWTGLSTYHSMPVLGGDTLYVIGPGADRATQRRLHAFAARTGHRRWARTAPAGSLDDTIPLSADAHSVRLLLSSDLSRDEDRTILRSYAARDGRLLWETERQTSSYALTTAPDGRLVVGHLYDWYGYDSRTGKPSWRGGDTGEATAATAPLGVGGRLFCVNEVGVTAVHV